MANFGNWEVFLSSVDEVADSALIAALEPKLVQAGWRKPTDLVGALPAEVVVSLEGVSPPGKAFVRRSVEEAQARQLEHRRRLLADAEVQDNAQGTQAIVPAVAPQSPAQQQPELLSQLQGLLGTEQSALAVAQALASNDTKPSVAKLMETAGLDSISDHYCPDEETFVAVKFLSFLTALVHLPLSKRKTAEVRLQIHTIMLTKFHNDLIRCRLTSRIHKSQRHYTARPE